MGKAVLTSDSYVKWERNGYHLLQTKSENNFQGLNMRVFVFIIYLNR